MKYAPLMIAVLMATTTLSFAPAQAAPDEARGGEAMVSQEAVMEQKREAAEFNKEAVKENKEFYKDMREDDEEFLKDLREEDVEKWREIDDLRRSDPEAARKELQEYRAERHKDIREHREEQREDAAEHHEDMREKREEHIREQKEEREELRKDAR